MQTRVKAGLSLKRRTKNSAALARRCVWTFLHEAVFSKICTVPVRLAKSAGQFTIVSRA